MLDRAQNVVPTMAMGVAELKKELAEGIGLNELPEIHQFLDGFYLSRIGIRILIGQHIALHEPQRENYIGRELLVRIGVGAVCMSVCVCMRLYACQHTCKTVHES